MFRRIILVMGFWMIMGVAILGLARRSPATVAPWIATISNRAESEGDIFLVDFPSGQNPRRLTLGLRQTHALVWSPDGAWLGFLATDKMGMNIYRVHIRSRRIEQVTATAAPKMNLAWSPDGNWLSFTESNGLRDTLMRVQVDGSGRQVVVGGRGRITSVAWSPDGAWLLFGRQHEVYKIRPDGHDLTPLGAGTMPAWSPDGQTIAYSLFGVALMNTDGSNVRVLNADLFPLSEGTWSPDGKTLLITAVTADSDLWEAYRVRVSDGTATPLPSRFLTYKEHQGWSPDGVWAIVRSTGTFGSSATYWVRPDGSELITGENLGFFAVVSPPIEVEWNGAWLMFGGVGLLALTRLRFIA